MFPSEVVIPLSLFSPYSHGMIDGKEELSAGLALESD